MNTQSIERDHPGAHLVDRDEWEVIGQGFQLSPRELSVLMLFFEGNPYRQIARELSITPRTVRHHIEHIHRKLAVCDQVELVLAVIEARDELRQVTVV